jgi:hypothetical protein
MTDLSTLCKGKWEYIVASTPKDKCKFCDGFGRYEIKGKFYHCKNYVRGHPKKDFDLK